MKVKPLGDRVLVEVLEAEEMTKGGIVLPDTAKEKPQQAKVVSVGKGKVTDEGKTVAPEVKEGDIVLYGKYSGTELKIDERNLLMLKEEDILGIVA
jgi:chaperonin GroES